MATNCYTMPSQYVKFFRGTPAMFNQLVQKDDDTLYFIANPEDLETSLYLGRKLIAGGNKAVNASSIGTLKDVLISEHIDPNSLLVYDEYTGAWVNQSLENIINIFVGATTKSAGIPGLVPAPKAGETNLFLRSDGTWATPAGGTSTPLFWGELD